MEIELSFICKNSKFYFHHPRIFVPSLIEVGPLVLEKKIFLSEKAWLFIWAKVYPHHPRMFCVMFGWNLPSGSGRRWKCEKLTKPTTTTMDNETDELKTNTIFGIILDKLTPKISHKKIRHWNASQNFNLKWLNTTMITVYLSFYAFFHFITYNLVVL